MLSILPFQDFLRSSAPTVFSLSVVIALSIVVINVLLVYSQYAFSSKAPKSVHEGYPILGAIRFFTARWDFFRQARDKSASGNFSFRIGEHQVIGLSGDKGRQLFFEHRDLDFGEGYAILFRHRPRNSAVTQDKVFSGPKGYFQRRLTRMLRTENFSKSLPRLMSDVQTSLKQLARDPSGTGITDPFQSIYKIVYQLTVRMLACDDVADDPELLDKTLHLYQMIMGRSIAATAIIFPWFPSLAIIRRTIAGGRLYLIVQKIIEQRNKTGKRGDDALQYFIDQGDDVRMIVEFIVGGLFAGLLNSGINAAWVLVYLSKSPHWLSNVREEVKSTAAKYSVDKEAPLVEQLSQVPLEAWESEFPVIDMCLRDSIRLNLLGTAFRKNVSGKDIPIGSDEVIPPGAFVAYAIADVHLNPMIYKDPEKWDPSRYLSDRAEDKKNPLSYLGWGVGRHPCLGMRFAKLEQNIITAFFTAMFDFELTDNLGNPLKEVPKVDFNGHSAKKPIPSVYLKYSQRV